MPSTAPAGRRRLDLREVSRAGWGGGGTPAVSVPRPAVEGRGGHRICPPRVRGWHHLSRTPGGAWSTTPPSSRRRRPAARCCDGVRQRAAGVVRRPGRLVRGHATRAARVAEPGRPCRWSSPAAPARSAGALRLARKPDITVAGVEIALRDLDDLAGNARRVVAAVDEARGEGLLADDVQVYVELPHDRRVRLLAGGRRRGGRGRAAAEVPHRRARGRPVPDLRRAGRLDRRGAGPRDAVQVHRRTAPRRPAPRPRDRLRAPRLPQRAGRDPAGFDGASPARGRDAARRPRPQRLVALARDSDLAGARRWFTSFGSCTVTEPLDDLRRARTCWRTPAMTHDWVDGAAGSALDVDNLPYGVFSRPGERAAGRRPDRRPRPRPRTGRGSRDARRARTCSRSRRSTR